MAVRGRTGARLGLVLVVLLTAGCVQSQGHLEHEGEGSGRDEDTVWCEGDAALDVTLTVVAANSGSFRVIVDDGGGTTAFEKAYTGRDDDTQRLSGSAGMWRLVVERETGFDGKYGVTLACGENT